METRKIELGDVFYVFSNWGLVEGKVIKIEKYLVGKDGYEYDITTGEEEVPTDEDGNEIDEFEIYQYKLNINIDEDNKNIKYGFFYSEDQLYNSPEEAINDSIKTWKLEDRYLQ